MKHYSNRVAATGAEMCRFGGRVIIHGDNKQVVMQHGGEWACSADPYLRSCTLQGRWLVHCMRMARVNLEFKHIFRRFNREADEIANAVLDGGHDCIEWADECAIDRGSDVHVFFDGACRGNPGPGACAAIAYEVSANLCRPVLIRAYSLGVVTNVIAEFEGFLVAIRASLNCIC